MDWYEIFSWILGEALGRARRAFERRPILHYFNNKGDDK
jgi:hypothetical protein